MVRRGLETIQTGHQFSSTNFDLKIHVLDNNESINVHILFFVK